MGKREDLGGLGGGGILILGWGRYEMVRVEVRLVCWELSDGQTAIKVKVHGTKRSDK